MVDKTIHTPINRFLTIREKIVVVSSKEHSFQISRMQIIVIILYILY